MKGIANRALGPGKGYFFMVLALLLVAFFLRSILLDRQSLWADEAYSVSLATRASWQLILEEVLSGDPYTPHTPLYYLALMPWLSLAGDSDFALRWFSVASGLLTVPLCIVLARRLAGKNVALIVGLLSALSPFLVYYSQEARMYALSGFFAALAVYSCVRALADEQRRWWVVYAISAIALIFTFNLGLVLIGAMFLVALFPRLYRPRERYSSLACHILIGLVFIGWQAVQATRFQMVFSAAPLEAFGLLAVDALKDNILAQTLGVTLDRAWAVDRVYSFRGNPLQPWDRVLQPHYTTAVAVGIVGLAVAGVWKLSRLGRRGLCVVVAGIIAVAGAVYLLRLTTPGYAVRLGLIVTPLFLILLAAGALALPRRLRPAMLGLLVVGMGLSLWQYYQNPVFSRSEYRSLARYVSEEWEKGDAAYLHGPVLRLLQDRYASGLRPVYSLPRSIPVDYNWGEVEAQLRSLTEQHSRLWLVLGGEGDYDPARRIEGWLLQRGYQVEDQWFGNSRLGLFVFPRNAEPRVLAGRFVGGGLDLQETRVYADRALLPGQALPMALTWRRVDASPGKYRLSLRITDGERGVWAQRDVDLGTHSNPVSQWPADTAMVLRTGLRLPTGIPPGTYSIESVVYESNQGPLPGGQLEPFKVLVEPGPPGLAGRMRPPNRVQMPFGPLRLVGFRMPREVIPGLPLILRLYWEVEKPPQEDFSLAVRLGTGPVRELPLVPGYPTSRWREKEAVVSQHVIRLPASVQGWQTLEIGLAGKSGPDLVLLGGVEVPDLKREYRVPEVQQRHQVELGGRVELIGVDYENPSTGDVTLIPGTMLEFSIHWKALREMDTSYTVFVQVLDAEGRLVVTEDSLPLRGQRPTTGWLPEEVLLDTHRIRVPDSAGAGRYSLIAGMYDAKTGKRLTTAGGDFVFLTNAVVKARYP